MNYLRQSTSASVKMGPFVDDADAVTLLSALTIQKADVRVSKEGGNYGAAHADQGASDAGAPYDESGEYDIALDTTDTNTVGELRVMIVMSGALLVWKDFTVLAANVYDSIIAGSAFLKVDVTKFLTADPTPSGIGGIVGAVGKAGTSYFLKAALIINGAQVAGASLSAIDATFYDFDGTTDLGWSGTAAAQTNGDIVGNGTLTTPPTNNKPYTVLVEVTYGGYAYSASIPVVNVA